MIGQADQASNQYGFYAVPKALEPRRKYRDTYDEDDYSDEEADEDNVFETIEREPLNERELDRDYYVDEAPYPEFKPKERGLDYGVQIERHELFDFDLEVQPLIEILVGRSVVSAINELQEEKEASERAVALTKFERKRNAELMATQRLEMKDNRKREEAERRQLEKKVCMKNKKLAAKKLVSRRNAKHCLLNMRGEVLEELEQEGFLRESPYLTLRVQYEGWLYEQVKAMLDEESRVRKAAQRMVQERETELRETHSKFIEQENKRRKDILDERERVRKANEERKLKKRIRKERLQLNEQRAGNEEKAAEALHKYEAVEKILKSASIGNGLTKVRNSAETVQVSGGLLNFVVAFLSSTEADLSLEETEHLIDKLLKEIGGKLELPLLAAHFEKVEEAKKKLEEEPIEFMNNKESNIQELVSQVSLDLSLLESTGISIKSSMHNHLLTVLLSIYLNALPEPKMEGEEVVASYEPS